MILDELMFEASIDKEEKGTLLNVFVNASKTEDGIKITKKTKNVIWNGFFNCSYGSNYSTTITSLKWAPTKVTKWFFCFDNKLTSLEYCPTEIGGDFNCSDNQLTSLEHCPTKIGGDEGDGDFDCSNNKLTSLKNIHKQLTKMDGDFYANKNPIKSHVLGLLLIKGCTGVTLDNKEVEAILNKYLPNTRGNKGLIECQSELLDADLDDFAEL